MISKKELQYYSSLLSKKHRQAENKFIVEGKKSVLEGLNSSYNCEIVFVTNKFNEDDESAITEIIKKKKRIETLKQKDFLKIADTETPQGIAAVFVKPKLVPSEPIFIDDKIIVELKAKPEISGSDIKQVLSYLESHNIKLGLIINFGKSSLETKRIINSKI